MLSKKQSLVLAATAIAGTGIGLMLLAGGGDKEEGDEKEKQMKKQELMLRYEAPVYSPSEIYAPYSESNITRIVHNILAPAPEQAPIIPGNAVIREARRRPGGGYEPAPDVPGHVPMGVSDNTWSYATKTAAIQEAVRGGLPQEVAERELSVYTNRGSGGGGSAAPKAAAPKKSTYKRRSETGYTYRGGKLVSK